MKKLIIFLALVFAFNSNDSFAQCEYIALDGVDECLYTPFKNYDFHKFTLECWINVPNYTNNVHYISLKKNAYLVLGHWNVNGSFNLWAQGVDPRDVVTSKIDDVNTWQHIAYVFDSTYQSFYLNGVLDTVVPTTDSVYQDSTVFDNGLIIGARFDTAQQFVEGFMDEVRIWTIPRTQSEIQDNMNTELTGTEEGLVAYYQFNDGPGSDSAIDLTGNGNHLKLLHMEPEDWINLHTRSVIDTSTCISYTSPSGKVWTHTDSYLDTISNSVGCDSIISINLSINTVDTGVVLTNTTLTADAIGATYQWLDCNDSYSIIGGATSQSYTPVANGNYAVEVTESECVDTSACIDVIINQLKNNFGSAFKIFPNPAKNYITIELGDYYYDVSLSISNLHGQKISDKYYGYTNRIYCELKSSKGFYFLEIKTKEGKMAKFKIMKE